MAGTGNRQTLTANGTTTNKTFQGPVVLSISGGFGGGTATLQRIDPSGAAVSVSNGAFTSATDTIFDFPIGASNDLQVVVTGSTTPTFVIWIQGEQLGTG